jgi:hypothetical protein
MYSCENCGSNFKYISHFQDHIASPTACEKAKNKKFDCSGCGKKFTTETSCKNHMIIKCGINPELDILKAKIAELEYIKDELKESKEEIQTLKTQIKTKVGRPRKTINSNTNSNNNTNTNTNSHNTNNDLSSTNTANMINSNNTTNQTINTQKLTIVNFGKEDIDKLSDDDKKEILNSCYGAILRCAKKVNFNPEFPEQRNVFLTNPKAEFAYKYAMNKYQAIETNDLLDQIIYHRANDVRDLIEQNDVLQISDSKIERVNKLLTNIDNEKPEDIAYIKKDLRLILFNENEQALENKKKYDDKQKLLKCK